MVGRGRKIQCAAARRQILGTLARPRRGHQGKSQNPLHFLHHGAVRIYLKGAHRIQRPLPQYVTAEVEIPVEKVQKAQYVQREGGHIPARLVAVPQREKAGVLPQLCRKTHYYY